MKYTMIRYKNKCIASTYFFTISYKTARSILDIYQTNIHLAVMISKFGQICSL